MGSTTMPAPDNSVLAITSQQNAMASMHQSDNMYQLGMAQIGASIMQSQGMFILGSSQIQANTDLGHERNELAMNVARMNYDLQSNDRELDHEEKMKELSVRKHEIDMEAKTGNQVDTSDWSA